MKLPIDKRYLIKQIVLTLLSIAIIIIVPMAFFSEDYRPYLEKSISFVILVVVMIATSLAFAFAQGAIKFSTKRDDKEG